MGLYGVVVMDIVGSRNIRERGQLQAFLINCIGKMNQKHSLILTTPISITLGDEWQLITHYPAECYNLVHEFQQLLWEFEIDFYAGIGIGRLSTPVFEEVRFMDGPCFNLAREAVNIIGILERLFIICAIVLGIAQNTQMVQIIGFVLATKSVARFKEFDDRDFVEYFIIGSFISFTSAILIGVAIRALLYKN